MSTPVRIGMLGCAVTAEFTMFQAIREGAPFVVAAVAARDPDQAQVYARQWNIPNVFPSYDALLAEADVDAIYVPLPNGLHHHWVLRAIEAGRHILCEKPLAVDAAQAAEMVAAAEARGSLLVEAFHWRLHPLAQRLRALVREGAIGDVRSMDCSFEMGRDNLLLNDIRLSPELGGGSLLDTGCYCVNFARFMTGSEPQVRSAGGSLLEQGVDGAMQAELVFDDGIAAHIRCGMILPGAEVTSRAHIVGSRGTITAENIFLPGWGGRITLVVDGETRVEEAPRLSSYYYQAIDFAERLRNHVAGISPARDAVANMRVVDAIRSTAEFESVTR